MLNQLALIGTMNSFDKSSLYKVLALMRLFSIVHIGLPSEAVADLLRDFAAEIFETSLADTTSIEESDGTLTETNPSANQRTE